ncbi:hypothetical protein BD779DRAFT_1668029 [Infundibulicybe gibba]|nr:hypothetical protein BD779DRAFT_1668029 [Infundibulicybe gibba]
MSEPPKITFMPPLHLQRRIWILDALREFEVTSVLDAGCGEGQLLSVLAQPAPWLAEEHEDAEVRNLHIRAVHGVDVCAEDLAFAVGGCVAPVREEGWDRSDGSDVGEEGESYAARFVDTLVRWEPLTVKIWQGALEVPNEEFIGIECIVCTEVIEHLPIPVVPALAPVLLGIYRPKYLLLTTPNYEFNILFAEDQPPTSPIVPSPPSAFPQLSSTTPNAPYSLRHPDHKFEFTRAEFEEYCAQAARDWGYIVKTSTIGRCVQEHDVDDEIGGASCVALFTRIDNDQDQTALRTRAESVLESLALPPSSPTITTQNAPAGYITPAYGRTPHTLLATHNHVAHPRANRPRSPEAIMRAVQGGMARAREEIVRLEELWYVRGVAVRCGGHVGQLVTAVEGCETMRLRKEGKRERWTAEMLEPRFKPVDDGWDAPPVRPHGMTERGSVEWIPRGWLPEEDEADSAMGNSSEWKGENKKERKRAGKESGWGDEGWGGTGDEGDVSRAVSEYGVSESEGESGWGRADAGVSSGWGSLDGTAGANGAEGGSREQGDSLGGWSWPDNDSDADADTDKKKQKGKEKEKVRKRRNTVSLKREKSSETTGWDGDEDFSAGSGDTTS